MSRRPFQLLIKPVGADCNLRCDYCFYLRANELYPQPGRHIMSDEVLERTIAGLMQHRFPQSIFAWQGGEPMLAGIEFFRKVVALEQKHGVAGQSVCNGLQTNGTLIDGEWCRLFRDYSFLVGLSLDGPQDVHDAIRHSPGGRGTWDTVMAAANSMRRYGVEFNILCVVHAGNVGMGADLLRWLVAQGFTCVQFIPCNEPGLSHNVTPEAYGRFLCDTFDYYAKEGFGRVSIRDFDAMLAMRMRQPVGLCTYSRTCNSYLVVEHTGDVYPCDFFVHHEWKLGNVMDAPLESFLDSERYREFAAGKDGVAACRRCQWRKMCHGGCQKDRRSPGSAGEPTVFCEAYRQFFKHAMPMIDKLAKRAQRQAQS